MSMLRILQGDALEKLRTLPDESVQCCVTSPPYDDLRTYGGGQSWDFERTALELYRVLCGGGVICWNVNDSVVDGSETLTSAKQKLFFRERCGFRIHDTMIYEKSNFGHPDLARYHQLFEYVIVLSKGGPPRAFNPICDKRNVTAGFGTVGINTHRERDGSMTLRKRNTVTEYGKRGNVWRGNTAGQENMGRSLPHPAIMPKWLARDLVISWSNPGDVILDPFAGSGTTGHVALELGRRAILIELNPKYIELIERRCSVTMGLALAS